MVRIVLSEQLAGFTGGERELSMEVDRYRDVVVRLLARWPEMHASLERTAVAIDGQIHQDALDAPLRADSEVFFMPRIESG